MAREKKIAKYLDIPLQHISNRILKEMGRKTTKQKIVGLLHKLRTKVPGIILRTTFIVGFPGETKADFGELYDFAREMKLDRVGVFAYSREPGTRAAKMPGQVDGKTKVHRLDSLMRLQQKISLTKNRLRIGQSISVMIEGQITKGTTEVLLKPGYQYYGRSYAEAPEIDGKIYVKTTKSLKDGNLINICIDNAWAYDLGGSTIR